MAEYEASIEEIEVSDDLVSIIVGKKWANISKLRERFPDAVIEIDMKTVKIQVYMYVYMYIFTQFSVYLHMFIYLFIYTYIYAVIEIDMKTVKMQV
jgi:hypothetical protein